MTKASKIRLKKKATKLAKKRREQAKLCLAI